MYNHFLHLIWHNWSILGKDALHVHGIWVGFGIRIDSVDEIMKAPLHYTTLHYLHGPCLVGVSCNYASSIGPAHIPLPQARPQAQAISQSTSPPRPSTRSLNGTTSGATASCASTPPPSANRRLPTLMLTVHPFTPSVIISRSHPKPSSLSSPAPGPAPALSSPVTCVHSFTSSLTGMSRTTS